MLSGPVPLPVNGIEPHGAQGKITWISRALGVMFRLLISGDLLSAWNHKTRRLLVSPPAIWRYESQVGRNSPSSRVETCWNPQSPRNFLVSMGPSSSMGSPMMLIIPWCFVHHLKVNLCVLNTRKSVTVSTKSIHLFGSIPETKQLAAKW